MLYPQRLNIRGYVEDESSGERLPGATIVVGKNNQISVTNGYGFFSLTINNLDPVDLQISHIGYQSLIFNTLNVRDTLLVFKLQTRIIEINEVVIRSSGSNKIAAIHGGQIDLPLDLIKSSPALLGEQDLIKSLLYIPGVQFATEGTANISIRGGAPEHNLVLIDDVPVYSSSHLFGVFSIYNTDALKSATLIKGGYPARYGGRAASVLDLRLREGNMNQWQGNASLGIISSKFLIEGPLIKEKLSLIVAGRRSFMDLLAAPVFMLMDDELEKRSYSYYFYDITAKMNYVLDNNNRFFISYYAAKDPFRLKVNENPNDDTGILKGLKNEYRWRLGYGNNIASMRWNHVFNNGLFANTTVKFSNFNYYNSQSYHGFDVVDGEKIAESSNLGLFSGLRDLGGKIDLDYSNLSYHYIRFGTEYTLHAYNPGREIFYLNDLHQDLQVDSSMISEKFKANEFSFYVEDEWNINKRLGISMGYRMNIFSITDHTSYLHHEPRLGIRYMFSQNISVNSSYSRVGQNIHLLSNSGISMPTDLWVPSTKNIEPVTSEQVSLGINLMDKQKHFLFTAETYYKTLNNVLEYKDGASFFDNASWQNKVGQGRGLSYGIEFMLEKRTGRMQGWVSYTLSKADRQFDSISFGRIFPYKYDRRHNLSFTGTYKISDSHQININWIFATGNPITFAFESFETNLAKYPYIFNGDVLLPDEQENYTLRNNYRLPSYHRLDVGYSISKKKKWGIGEWSFGVYNLYNRKNAFYLFESENKLYKASLLPFIPSISYSYKF
jgi:hypothetical protein